MNPVHRRCPYPQCKNFAAEVDRYTLKSTDGYIEHIMLTCGEHIFNGPVFFLEAVPRRFEESDA